MTDQELLDMWRREFEEKDGVLYNKKNGRALKGRSGRGYVTVRRCGKTYTAHRIIWALHHGEIPTSIDHINRIPWDNRIENLRCVSQSLNMLNRLGWGKWPKGISRDGGKYRVSLMIEGLRISLGTWDTEDQALVAQWAGEKAALRALGLCDKHLRLPSGV